MPTLRSKYPHIHSHRIQTVATDPSTLRITLAYVSASVDICKLNACTISTPILLVTNERQVRHGIPEKVCSDSVLHKVRKQ